MNVAAGEQERNIPAASAHSTIFIRFWHEEGSSDDPLDQSSLRGTVIDLSGYTLGHFAGLHGLFDLVRDLTSRPPARRPSRGGDNQ